MFSILPPYFSALKYKSHFQAYQDRSINIKYIEKEKKKLTLGRRMTVKLGITKDKRRLTDQEKAGNVLSFILYQHDATVALKYKKLFNIIK